MIQAFGARHDVWKWCVDFLSSFLRHTENGILTQCVFLVGVAVAASHISMKRCITFGSFTIDASEVLNTEGGPEWLLRLVNAGLSQIQFLLLGNRVLNIEVLTIVLPHSGIRSFRLLRAIVLKPAYDVW